MFERHQQQDVKLSSPDLSLTLGIHIHRPKDRSAAGEFSWIHAPGAERGHVFPRPSPPTGKKIRLGLIIRRSLLTEVGNVTWQLAPCHQHVCFILFV